MMNRIWDSDEKEEMHAGSWCRNNLYKTEEEMRGHVYRILGQLRAVSEGSVKKVTVVFILGFRKETILQVLINELS
jgi:hypothetical protein